VYLYPADDQGSILNKRMRIETEPYSHVVIIGIIEAGVKPATVSSAIFLLKQKGAIDSRGPQAVVSQPFGALKKPLERQDALSRGGGEGREVCYGNLFRTLFSLTKTFISIPICF